MLKDELNKLTTNDVYSLILFTIFQLKKLPEYAVLSELIYSLDRDSLLNLCKQFGGMTITIPTLDDLNVVVNALLLYCYVQLEHKTIEESLEILNKDQTTLEQIKSVYMQIGNVISDYDFRRF